MQESSRVWTILAGYLATLAAVVVLLSVVTYPALVDYPNHLARFYITANIDQDPVLQKYYVTEWSPIPYLGADALAALLFRAFDPNVVGKTLVALIFVFWLAAVAALYRVLHGRYSLWPLFAVLVIFNGNLAWGFLNYLLSSALAIFGFALWILLQDRHRAARLVIATGVSTIVYLAHLYAFGVYGLLVVLYEAGRLIERRPRSARLLVRHAGWTLLQFVPAGILLSFATLHVETFQIDFGQLIGRLAVLLSATQQYDFFVDISVFFYVALVICFGLFRGARLVLHPSMNLPLVGIFIVALAAPINVFGSAFISYRLPFVLLALFIAASRFDWPSRWESRILAASFVLVLSLRLLTVWQVWDHYDQQTRELVSSFEKLDRGSKILIVGYGDFLTFGVSMHLHIASYAVIEKQVFLPNLFTGLTVLKTTEKFRHLDRKVPQPIPEKIFRQSERFGHWATERPPFDLNDLTDWTHNYDYVLHLNPLEDTPLFPRLLRQIVRGSFFSLYEVVQTRDASGSD